MPVAHMDLCLYSTDVTFFNLQNNSGETHQGWEMNWHVILEKAS